MSAPRHYPTYRFNKEGAQVRVENEIEDRALDGEWFDHPPTREEVDDRFADDIDDTDAMLADEDADESGTTKKKKKGRG